jgi:hypothetical protein
MLSPALASGEVWRNCLRESPKRFRIQEPEHEMRHSQGMEAFQFLDHFRAATSHKMLLRTAYNLALQHSYFSTCCISLFPFHKRLRLLCFLRRQGNGDFLCDCQEVLYNC